MNHLAIHSFFAASLSSLAAQTAFTTQDAALVAPPKPPPLIEIGGSAPKSTSLRSASTLYSIGEPTSEEQLYLELINRARANPQAEADLLANYDLPEILAAYNGYAVDLSLMKSQFSGIAPAQPLAMNAKLTTAAREHSQDMLENVFQDHSGSDGRSPFDRLSAVGYIGSAGENIYSNAKSVTHGHAAFEVDWGGPPEAGGMQTPPGHRQAIHNPIFREVGIGVVLGSNAVPGKQPLDNVGPQLVTQDFGTAQNSTPFITGVAYYDVNGNNFYDIGEGIGNVKVTVTPSTFEAITARSGGYAVPVAGNGNYTVTFSGAGFPELTRNVSVVGSKNVKIDFVPPYTAPTVSGPLVPAIGRNNAYSISSLPGASAYEWRLFQKSAAGSEGAENDTANVSITQSGNYDAIQGIMVKSGSFAFHLVHPETTQSVTPQYINLTPTYLINSGSSISFQGRLGVATPYQHGQLQVSTDNGATWQVLYDEPGTIDSPTSPAPDSSFKLRTLPLDALVGKTASFRFAYVFLPGTERVPVYTGSSLDLGWLIDDIQFTNVQEITNERVSAATGTTFHFQPEGLGDFSLQARVKTGNEFLDWGPALAVRSAPGAAEVRLSVSEAVNGQIQIDAEVDGKAPGLLVLEARSALNLPWQAQTVTVENVSATRFRMTLPKPNTRTQYYRVRAE